MIDIIIPIYNSSKTIVKTLNSILEQVNINDIKVYLIDDCSTENYKDIIKFFSQYMKIEYHKLEKNSGPGVARQYGLDNSDGEFIIFIDSDDEFYSNDSVLKLYNAATSYDMVFATMMDKNYNDLISFHECCLHGKLYRRSFIKRKNIKFNNLRSHEDNAFNQLCLATCESINYLDDTVYIYNHNEKSITNNENDINSMKLYIQSMTWLFKQIEKQDYINQYYVGIIGFSVILYTYFHYLLDNKKFSFIIKKLGYIKEMYNKYIDNISYDDKLRIYKNFDYPVIPDITIEQFLDLI